MGAAGFEPIAFRHTGGERVGKDLIAGLLHQIAERGEGSQLARGEQVGVPGHAVALDAETQRCLRKFGVGHVLRNGTPAAASCSGLGGR